MALSVVSLAHGTSSASTITTASITPGTNTLVLLIAGSEAATPTGLSPINGLGLTWVNIVSDLDDGTAHDTNVWRAMASSPSTGTISISNGNTLQVIYDLLEVRGGVDTSGTNGSGAVVQNVQHFGSSPNDAGLAATAATSAIVGWAVDRDASASITPGLTQLNNFGASNILLATQWTTNSVSGACSFSFTSPTNIFVGGIEVKVGAPPPPWTFMDAWTSQGTIIIPGRAVMVPYGPYPGPRST